MKHLILTTCWFFLIICSMAAQAPQKFRYQAVARDQNGALITGNIGVRLGFLEDGPNGASIYSETHAVNASPDGVFDLVMGDGIPNAGSFSDLNWKTHQYWLKIEMKAPGAGSFTEMGKSQLLSVPYAMYAAESGKDMSAGTGISINNGVISNTGDLSATNELQSLSLNGNILGISGGNTVALPTGTTYTPGNGIIFNGNSINASDPSPTNELQTLAINGNILAISDGNTVTLPPTIYTPGAGININGNVISASDPSSANELQALSVNGNQLSISSGNTVTLPSATYSGGLGIQINGNTINATDASPTNEIQTLSLNGNQLSLSNGGGSVQLPASQWTGSGSSIYYSAGNVGIGTPSPAFKLSVVSSSNGGIFTTSSDGYGISSLTSGPYAAGFFHGTDGSGGYFFSDNHFAIQAVQSQYGNSQVNQGVLLKYQTDEWKTYIDSYHDYNFAYNNTLKGYIMDSDGTYHNYSDRRLKKDIKPFSNVLASLTKLQAYTYRMKDATDDSPVSVGFIAQDVEAQFPDLVVEKNGYKSICYDHFTVLSVEAIKEQQEEINSLKKEVEALKQMVRNLSEK